jgi:hypothetical protein
MALIPIQLSLGLAANGIPTKIRTWDLSFAGRDDFCFTMGMKTSRDYGLPYYCAPQG